MNGRAWFRWICFLAMPAALAIVAVVGTTNVFGVQWSATAERAAWGLALAVSVYAGIMVVLWRRAATQNAQLQDELRIAEKRGEFLERRFRSMRSEIELLAAMREVTRVVTNEVDFERILDQVLKIVEDLLESDEITIFLADESGTLRAEATRRGGATFFGRSIKRRSLDTYNVREAYETRTVLRSVVDDVLHLVLPLRADQECLGVLKVSLSLDGTPEAKAERAELFERQARNLAEHIAVAIKTSHLHDKAIVDGLTKLYTKRHFEEQLRALFNFSHRHGKRFSLVMLDIDHFKSINDTYGHPVGDAVLQGVAQAVRKSLRRYDMAFRYGGEELAVLLPETRVTGARAFAERVRQRIESKTFRTDEGKEIRVTVSLGVAETAPARNTPEAIVAAADAALYQAKSAGRNCVCVAGGG